MFFLHIYCLRFSRFFVNVVSVAVDGDDAGEVGNLKAVDGFAEQIGKSDERTFSDRVAVKCARASDGGKVTFFMVKPRFQYKDRVVCVT